MPSAWEAKIRYKSGHFSIWLGTIVDSSVIADFLKNWNISKVLQKKFEVQVAMEK